MAAAVRAVRKKLAAERLRQEGSQFKLNVLETFSRYDADNSGDIDKAELRSALKELGLEVSDEKLEGVMQKYCEQGADSLDLDTFDMLVSDLNQHMKQARRSSQEAAEQARRAAPPPPEAFLQHSIRGKGKPLPHQAAVRRFYQHPACVWTIACVIIANFLVNIIEKEIDADLAAMKYTAVWDQADAVFNIIFLFELLTNMYGYGGPVRAFWRSPWNVFDFFIVVVGVTLMAGIIPSDSPAGKLKLLRAFRVFRLFKRIKSLNKIIVALIRAIPGVFNAFVVMFIFFCIYAILAVELFRDFGNEGSYTTTGSSVDDVSLQVVSSETARGMTNGYEYYGTFMRALYTLFQVMTGESWSEAIARPLVFGLYDNAVVVALFYVSFILLTQLVLTNVVVAVLLDNFVTDPDAKDGDGDAAAHGGGVGTAAGSSFLEAIPPAKVLPAGQAPPQVEAVALESLRSPARRLGAGADASARLEALEASVEGLRLDTLAMQTSLEGLHAKLDRMLVREPVVAEELGS